MITVYSLVALANRDRMSLNTLALTAIIMLLWNPLYLYDVGFQMSFLAVLFILLFFKPIYALIPERWLHPSPDTHHSTLITQHSTLNTRHFFRWSWAMVVVSLCAQMGTFPLTMYYFGRFSVYFLLTNFLVIPLASCILYLTAAMLLLSWWPAAQSLVAQPLIWVVDFQNTALRWIASLPASHIENITLSRLHVILIYAALFILLFLFSRYRNKRVTKELR